MKPTVKVWDEIVVNYVGKFTDGKVFDTSIEEVAKESGVYSEQRDYTTWLPFKVGAGQMIKGFDAAVVGMKVGETKTVEIPAVDAYGEKREDLIMAIEKSKLPAGEYKKWMMLSDQMGNTFEVVEVSDNTITLDANNKMAGKDLVFDITLLEIKDKK